MAKGDKKKKRKNTGKKRRVSVAVAGEAGSAAAGVREINPTVGRAFVIRGFGTKTDCAGNSFDLERIHKKLIGKAISKAGLEGDTTGEIVEAGNIRLDMFSLILEADLVICDISVHNANVFYELGIRHALRKKRTIMIKASSSQDATPFDIAPDRYLAYDAAKPRNSVDALTAVIKASLASEQETDSPVFGLLRHLKEQRPALAELVPIRVTEAIHAAVESGDRDVLVSIAQACHGERYMWSVLKSVGEAQWRLEDYAGARTTWEHVRRTHPDDLDANLALATVYERLHRDAGEDELLVRSDQALKRVLDNKHCPEADRVEALALRARNGKTRWRAPLAEITDRARARAVATSRELIRAYEGYRDAYQLDLNAYFPGDNAVQLGAFLQSLSAQAQWLALFSSDEAAHRYIRTLQADMEAMQAAVGWAVERALRRDPGDLWALATRANLALITRPDDIPRLLAAYRDALPEGNPRERDATLGQLALYVQLDFNREAAEAVIEEFRAD